MGEQQKTHRVLDHGTRGEAPEAVGRGAEPVAANPEPESPSACSRLIEEICERENLKQALKRVRANKGAPGVDGMTVNELPAFLREHWSTVRTSLLEGTYIAISCRRPIWPTRCRRNTRRGGETISTATKRSGVSC